MKKGFTLIELLAVIVILAIIALIATPIVLNIIEETKESAEKQSINNILRAAETYYTGSFINSSIGLNRNIYDKVIENIKGKKPDSGVIYINEEGNIVGLF